MTAGNRTCLSRVLCWAVGAKSLGRGEGGCGCRDICRVWTPQLSSMFSREATLLEGKRSTWLHAVEAKNGSGEQSRGFKAGTWKPSPQPPPSTQPAPSHVHALLAIKYSYARPPISPHDPSKPPASKSSNGTAQHAAILHLALPPGRHPRPHIDGAPACGWVKIDRNGVLFHVERRRTEGVHLRRQGQV